MRQDEFWFALAACAGAAVVLKQLAAWHGGSRRLRERRFELLAESLRDPALDQGTRAEVLRAIAREHRAPVGWLLQRLQSAALWRTLWFGTGWFGLLLSGALLLMGLSGTWSRWQPEPVVLGVVFSFAMLTLPLALRELARRETATGR